MAFDINKLSGREKNLIGFLLVILSTIPFFQFTLPAWNKYIDLNNKIKESQNKLTEIDTKIKKLEKLKSQNIELSKKIDTQKLYIAKSNEIDFLVQDLKQICDESAVSLESFTPADSEPINIVLEKQAQSEIQGNNRNRQSVKQALEKLKGQDLPVDLYRYPIEVKITGNFTDIIELFKKLEKYGRIISVENISIGKTQSKQAFGDRLSKSKSKKQSADTGSLIGTFDLVAFSLPTSDEKLPFSLLQKSIGGSKSTFSVKKKRS